MGTFFTKGIFSLVILATTLSLAGQDVRLNEVMSSNIDVIYDEDGDAPDWIELNNFGTTPANLGDYYLSDDPNDLLKWHIPAISITPGDPFLIFASDKDRSQINMNWYSVIDRGDVWNYVIPNASVPANWRDPGFDDGAWNEGGTSIGYGDGDDATYVPDGTISVFMRKHFTLQTIEGLSALWLHMDYDDSFVAYLNGIEIARANIGNPGVFVAYNETAALDHEAAIYNGGSPEAFNLSEMTDLLVEGDNVLAVQVHNVGAGSSDMSSIPMLTLGYAQPVNLNEPLSNDVYLEGGRLHTNFKLSSGGETLYLTHGVEGVVDSLTFGSFPANYSFGRLLNNPDELVYFANPTPEAPNGGTYYSEIIDHEVQFSINQMFLTSAQSLVLSGAGAGEQIRYTLNGADPTASSDLYTAPINISTNRVVKARITKTGALPGRITSQTYLFDSPHDLPVISLTTDPDNLWSNQTGIYTLGTSYDNNFPFFGANFWEDWERPAHIMMMEPSGQTAFSVNCGISIFGGWSRGNAQKSLSIFMRSEYGDDAIEYHLFDDKPIDAFHSIVLRNSGNDWNTSMIRDGMMSSLVRNLDIDLQAYRPAVMYLNGQYWGIHNIREKVNEDFLEANQGVPSDNIDLLEGNAFPIEGSNAAYLDMISFLQTSDISQSDNYEAVSERMDISNFADYNIAQIYFDNQDWPGNNIKFWRSHSDGGKWRWILFDTDFGFSTWADANYLNNTLEFATATNGPDWPNPPWSTYLLRRLLQNIEFRNYFINRFADLMNTGFKALTVKNHIDNVADRITSEMPRHSTRWQGPNIWAWNQEIEKMKNFANVRVYYLRNHIRTKFNLPAQYAVAVNRIPETGGIIRLNTLTLHEPQWSGVYFQTVPIRLTAQPNVGYVFDHWEVNGQTLTTETIELDITQGTNIYAYFVEGSAVTSIVINEINYNSPSWANAGDWVELLNPTANAIDLSAWMMKDDEDDHAFVIPEGTVIPAHGYLVLCQDSDKFAAIHPDVAPYAGEFDFGLGSSGDAVRLYDTAGMLVDSVAYGVSIPWPDAPNGEGSSLELIYYNYDNALPQSWQASSVNTGTPGQPNSSLTATQTPVITDGLEIYPNPFRDYTVFRPKTITAAPWTIQVFAADGRQCFETITQGDEFRWDGRDNSGNSLPAGVYGIRVETEQAIFATRLLLTQ